MARLYADVNFPRPTVDKLRKLGHDVQTVQQTEGTSRPESPMDDAQVLDFATSHRRAVLTLNVKHFERLHEQFPGHGGIIACKTDLDFRRQAKLIDRTIKPLSILNGQIIYVSPPSGASRRKRK